MTKSSVSVTVPTDLRRVLATDPKAKALWEDLTPIARRDFMSWIDSAKQSETRTRRLESVPSRLASGKRRPCCYAVVPMNLSAALKELPKAKAQWRSLTPDERRDFIVVVNAGKSAAERSRAIERVCALLLRRKHRP